MANLLSICQSAADECRITRPTGIAGVDTDDAQLFLRYANKVGRGLMQVYPWQVLRNEQTFTAIAGEEQTNIIPSDFDRLVPETFWNRSNQTLMSGPISAVEWQSLKALGFAGDERKFILRNDAISVIPVFGGGESLAFEYVSKNWVEATDATRKSSFTADTDVSLHDEDLMVLGVAFEYLVSEGQPIAQSVFTAYTDRYNTLVANDQPASGVLAAGDIFTGARHFTGAPPTNLNVRTLF